MKLPNPDQAIIPIEKLEGYSLNPQHPEGRHKARVFQSALNIGLEEAEILRGALKAMPRFMKLLDVVALKSDLPGSRLLQGQVGTITEIYTPNDIEVGFVDLQGQTDAVETLKSKQVMVLHHEPAVGVS